MELDWSTFLLEIVNFLILVWILKRFLYRPVLDAIAGRKKKIEETLNDARKTMEEANALQAMNERRRTEWEGRREALESELSLEIASKREKMLSQLEAEIGKERERQAALSEKRIGEMRHAMEDQAMSLGAEFASSLFARLASPELESMLFAAFMEDLENFDASQIRTESTTLSVSSAHPLPEEKRRLLLAKIESLLGRTMESSFSEHPDLVCGIRVSIGPWVLDANLKEELASFRGILKNG